MFTARFTQAHTAALGALLLALSSTPAWAVTATNLVQNGSFESFHNCYSCWNGSDGHQNTWDARSIQNNVAYSADYQTGGTSTWGPSMDGWTSGSTTNYALTASMATSGWLDFYGTTEQLAGNVTASPDGGNFVANSASMATSISGLTVGQTYAVSFYEALTYRIGYSGITQNTGSQVGYNVTFGTQTLSSDFQTLQPNTFSGWELETLYFTASNTQQSLTFQTATQGFTGTTPSYVFVLLDGVNVSASALPVPEPTSALMMSVGMFGLVALRLRSRRRENANG